MLEFLLFIAVVILLFWVSSLNGRLSAVEKKLKAERALSPSPAASAAMGAGNYVEPTAQIQPMSPSAPSGTPFELKPSPTEQTEDAAGWLTKIGILALIIGVGFFIKYAIDQGWISEWMRVILGLAAGGLLCFLGGLWKNKYPQYAAAISGGGVALMYFSVFAAYQFYHLVPQPVALVFLVLVSALGVYLAYDRKSLGLAALAVLGAYLAPIMLHAGTDQYLPLFIYLTLMNVVVIIISLEAYWNELLYFAFLGSMFDFVLWAVHYSALGNTFAATAFAAITFLLLLFGAALAFRKHFSQKTLPLQAASYLAGLAVLLGLFYSVSLAFLLYKNFHDYLAIMGLLGSVGAFLSYVLVDRLDQKGLNYALSLVGAGLLALSCIWQFSGKTTDFMLVAFGLFLVIAGALLRRAELRVWGLMTLVACVFAVLLEPYDMSNYVFILNSKFGLVMAETAALWAAGWIYSRVAPTEIESQAGDLANTVASLLLWFGFSWELVVYFKDPGSVNARNLLLSLWWIGYGTALMIFGAAAKSTIYKKLAIAIFVLAILKVFLYDVLTLETGYRIVSFIVLGVILLSVSYGYNRNKEKISNFLQG